VINLIEKLSKMIEESVRHLVDNKDVAIAFSGGVDSTLMAFLSKRYAHSVHLYTVGFENSEDIKYSKRIAPMLELPHNIYYLDPEKSKYYYNLVENTLKLGFLKSEILAPLAYLFDVVKEKFVVFGAASEELFCGYERYYTWLKEGITNEEINKRLIEEYEFLGMKGDIWAIKEIGNIFNKISLFPLYQENIARFVFDIPLNIRMKDVIRKKYLIREVAKYFSLPEITVNRKKRALQYGTGFHKTILKMKKRGEI